VREGERRGGRKGEDKRRERGGREGGREWRGRGGGRGEGQGREKLFTFVKRDSRSSTGEKEGSSITKKSNLYWVIQLAPKLIFLAHGIKILMVHNLSAGVIFLENKFGDVSNFFFFEHTGTC
jgi:hypothetical protein